MTILELQQHYRNRVVEINKQLTSLADLQNKFSNEKDPVPALAIKEDDYEVIENVLITLSQSINQLLSNQRIYLSIIEDINNLEVK